MMNEKYELEIVAKADDLYKVLEFVDDLLEERECSPSTLIAIDIAIEEIYVNIGYYAYPDENADGKGMCRIVVEFEGDDALVTFIDQGIPYNPLEKEDPDITLSAEDRPIGGLGIYMVKNSMDEVSYKYENGSNVFRIRKNMKS